MPRPPSFDGALARLDGLLDVAADHADQQMLEQVKINVLGSAYERAPLPALDLADLFEQMHAAVDEMAAASGIAGTARRG
jgi:hypothetical protein